MSMNAFPLLRMLASFAAAAPTTVVSTSAYTAPGLTESLAANNQSYVIGVISFVLFAVCTCWLSR